MSSEDKQSTQTIQTFGPRDLADVAKIPTEDRTIEVKLNLYAIFNSNNDRFRLIVVRVGGIIIGFAGIECNYIDCLYIADEFRDSIYAGLLFEELTRELPDGGYTDVNRDDVGMYLAHGFKKSKKKTYLGQRGYTCVELPAQSAD